MQTLSTTVDLIPDGMLLAQPVLDAHGQLLLPAGAPISRSALNSLQRRGVETIFVNPPPEKGAAHSKADPAAVQPDTEKRLLHLFRPAMEAGQLNPLFHLILRYRSVEKP
ncbi:MAG: hypothetical protein EON54_14525 [Alcaligenaceae bacterium]|nr:MAG: hypothetical protein EON54_14525 [Alcaligenaceae bacterium]